MSRSKPVQHCILMEFPRTRQFPILALNETDVAGREFVRLPTGLNDRREAYANECMCLTVQNELLRLSWRNIINLIKYSSRSNRVD